MIEPERGFYHDLWLHPLGTLSLWAAQLVGAVLLLLWGNDARYGGVLAFLVAVQVIVTAVGAHKHQQLQKVWEEGADSRRAHAEAVERAKSEYLARMKPPHST